jgi:hypothetical protein
VGRLSSRTRRANALREEEMYPRSDEPSLSRRI